MKGTFTVRQSTALRTLVEKTVANTPVYDIHTHLYDPAFGDLLLYGIDDLLVYHYLVAEAFRYFDIPYEKFWALTKEQQAAMIWDALFIQHSPISEACRGVLTTLNLLGLDVKKRDLEAAQMVRRLEAHGLRHALHGPREGRALLHDQLAVRRSGARRVGQRLPPRRAFHRRAAD